MQLFKESFKHLEKDPIMKFLIQKLGKEITLHDRTEKDLAKAISQLIIEQQVSFKAAITIKKRFNKLINKLSYNDILLIKDEKLKSIGISYRKVEYIKNVYSYFLKTKFDFFSENSESVVKELTKIKGIGKWTSEMFLIFILFKQDVFSKGDLALINSIKINYNISELNEPELNKLIDKWSPFKTIASLLLWKSIEERIFFKKTN
ncbi:MAG: DNA-3-methyladenine glycosylase 2 family protein [Cryomorphaceae bacterium]|jgi:DNA-3-methyladenine glycosylase II|nr:MAG: DNA-3-methyladenine glycosylase 2 family protein [Cryomorphaceae bacterium]